MTLLVGGLAAGLLLFFGLLIKYGKAYWLIAGYNTMPADKKKQVDTEGLGNFTGNLCFGLAALVFAGFLLHELGQTTLANVTVIMLIPVIIFALIWAQRYDGNTRDADGKMNAKSKRTMTAVITVLVIVAIGMGGMFYYSSRPAGYSIENGVLSISGIYGQEVRISDITNIQLIDVIPEITFKNNGSGLGNMMKGNFTVKGIGRAILFVDVSEPPFVFLATETSQYFLNGADPEETRALYQRLISEWNPGN